MTDSSKFPHISLSVRNDHLYEDLKKIIRQIRPEWPEDEIKYKESPKTLSHGVVNTMVISYIKSPSEDGIMCRVHGESKLAAFLSQDNEIHFISLIKQDFDFVPNILVTFENGFCYEYIIGEPLTEEKLKIEKIWRAIATQMAQMHSVKVPENLQAASNLYNFYFTEMDSYPEFMTDEMLNVRFKKEFPSKEKFLEEHRALIKEVESLNVSCVLNHSDPRPENMVWDEHTGKVTFVDFETCGFQSRTFDIACHFFRYAGIKNLDFNNFPNDEFQQQWLEVYLKETFRQSGRNPDNITHKDVEKIKVEVMKTYLLLLFVTVGGGVMTIETKMRSAEDFDYFTFSNLCYKEFLRIKDDILTMKVTD